MRTSGIAVASIPPSAASGQPASGRARLQTLLEELCGACDPVLDGAPPGRTAPPAARVPAGPVGRIVWLTGGIGSGRTTALTDAVERCRAAGVDVRLVLAGDPSAPSGDVLLEEVLTAAARGPVLVAVDRADRHHSDVLERIVAAADMFRSHDVLVLIVTAGPSDGRTVPSDPLLRGLATIAERVHLGPFDASALTELLRSRPGADSPPSPDEVEVLLRSTGGIPRLVAAALADLRDEDLPTADGWARVIGAAGSMLAALDPGALEAIACAALIDDPIDPMAVARACGDEGDAAIARALASGILVTDAPVETGPDDPPIGGAAADVRVRFAGDALRVAARLHDETGRAQRSLRIAQALRGADGIMADPRAVLRQLRTAGPSAPGDLLVEVAEAALAEARIRGELDGQLEALETLRSTSRDDADRWRELSTELATIALHVGRRDRAWTVARSVVRSFDGLPVAELDGPRRRVLVEALLVATTGQEYLSHEESDEAYELLLRTVARLDGDGHAARLLCRAAEIVSMRPHASALVRPWLHPDVPGPLGGDALRRADEEARGLLDRAQQLLGDLEDGAPALTATLDVAWARSHLHHEHAEERRVRLARSLGHLQGFDRAWAGTRLALDALAVGDRETVRQALIDASPTTIDSSPLVAWRVGTVRAMLLLATGTPGARAAVEAAARLGQRAAEPMAGVVALVQRGVARVEVDLSPLKENELTLAERDVHPLIVIGRLEIRARMAAMRRCITGEDDARLNAEASTLLDAVRGGRMNRGNQQLAIVLLARILFLLRHGDPDRTAVAEVADLLAPLGDLVPTDTLGLVCAGSAARHLANLRALQGRHEESHRLAERAHERDAALGLERFLIAGRIETIERRRIAGDVPSDDERAQLLADASEAERRELRFLGREARLLAHPELHGVLDGPRLELLEDLAEGLAFPEIAQRRGYSAGTMRKMALPVYRALGVSGRDEAVALGRRSGLLAREKAPYRRS